MKCPSCGSTEVDCLSDRGGQPVHMHVCWDCGREDFYLGGREHPLYESFMNHRKGIRSGETEPARVRSEGAEPVN